MLKRAIFKPHYQAFSIPEEEGVMLLSEDNNHIALKGKIYAAISSLLDGQHTSSQICDALSHEFPASEIYYAVMRLERAGYLVEADPLVSREVAAFWSLMNIPTRNLHEHLEKAQISIFFKNILPTQILREKLNMLGVQSEADGLRKFNVYIMDAYSQIEQYLFKEMTENTALTWLLIQPTSPFFMVGPILTRDKKICDACLMKQLHQKYILSLSEDEEIHHLAYDIASIEIAKFLIQPHKSQLLNKILEVNSSSWKMKYYSIKPNPKCLTCRNNQSEQSDA